MKIRFKWFVRKAEFWTGSNKLNCVHTEICFKPNFENVCIMKSYCKVGFKRFYRIL